MKARIFPLLASVVFTMLACSPKEQEAAKLGKPAPTWPDMAGVTLPCNLAPLTFSVDATCDLTSLQAIYQAGDKQVIIEADNNAFAIDPADWNSLIEGATEVSVRIQGKKDGNWVEYDAIKLSISPDRIDPWMSYRKIEPGHEIWGKMGIYQRNLETYEERAILTNDETNGGCMNCHSYNQRNPQQMLFHLRQELGGTYVIRNGEIEKLNTKTPQTISALVYPYWHPTGRYVAFSVNNTQQAAHSTNPNRVEVFDNESDVVVYDVEKHEIFTCPELKSEAAYETFPTFSPDGKMLYFCSADSVNVKKDYQSVHYSLCSIEFDAAKGGFGTKVDTLYNARTQGGSISFPRISPDGRWLMVTHHGYGNFSIWHKDADLWMLDLNAEERIWNKLQELNSNDVDSYHCWASNGRWVVFSSRRDNGLYTIPYLTHVDANGNFSKPFPVPQADAYYYDRCMKSFNIPEFMLSDVEIESSKISEKAKTDKGIDVQYRY